ncbi:MAG: hypothetical protein WBG27_15255 [Candidatus Aquilonibacter sp.]
MLGFSRLVTALFVAVLALAACGGGGSSALPAAGSVKAPSGSAALSIFVPNASASTSSRRRYQLPSTTQSVVIAVASATGTALNPPVAPVIANISATAAGCSSISGGISCTIDVTVPYGSLLFAVVGFTGQNGTGNAIAWGETAATISATGSNAVSITTTSVIEYAVIDLDGDFSLAVVDHSGNTVNIVNENNSTTFAGSIAYLPNGDEKIVVTSSTEGNTPVGSVVYVRELPGITFTFLSTNTSTPAVTGAVASSADWGVGTELTTCPTAAASYDASIAVIEGPEYQSNLTNGQAFQNGAVSISLSGGLASLSFSGNSYTVNGTLAQAETGNTGTCSSGQFAANTGPNGSGGVAFDAAGVIIGSNGPNGGQLTSSSDGFAGFSVASGSTVNLTAVTTQTYDGFFGGYTVNGSTVDKEGSPINAVPSGSNSMLSCSYTNFEAGTVATSGCATLTFGVQPQPGVVLGTFDTPTTGSVPAVFVISQISGKYVIFGLAGSLNAALIQH